MTASHKGSKTKRDARAWVRRGTLLALALAAVGLLAFRADTLWESPSRIDESARTTSPAATAQPMDWRDKRELAYDKDVATLEALIANESADAQTRTQAGERLARMVSDHQCELGVEAALRQAGFAPCLVLMQNGSLTVMVGEHELTGTQSVTILSVCVAHADVEIQNVRIMTGQEP